MHFNRTGASPRVPLPRLNELGIAIVSNATGALRASAIGMWDYLQEFARDDAKFLVDFAARTRDHPAGELHTFVGFP